MKNKGILEIFTRVTSKQLSFILPKTNKLKAKINILDLVHKTSNKGMRIPQQHKTSTEQESPQFQSKPNRKEQAHLKTQSITSTTLPNIKTGNTWPEKKKKEGVGGAVIVFSINTCICHATGKSNLWSPRRKTRPRWKP